MLIALTVPSHVAGAAQQAAGVAAPRPIVEAPKPPSEGPAPEPRDAEEKGWRFRWDDHPSVQFARGTRIDFRFRVQADIRDSEAPMGDPATLDIARRRVGVEGRLLGALDFEIDRELQSDRPWRDVYVNYRRFSTLRVQAGQFKLPFGLDENTGPTNLDFVHRSRAANQLAPGRDRGAMVHGRVLRGLVRYELGWFDRDGRNARTNNPERVSGEDTRVGRLALQPFRRRRSALADLHVAVAFTASQVPEGFPALRGRTALDTTFFQPDFWVRGQRRRIGFEGRWRPGPVSVKAEYIRVTTERLGQSVEDSDLSPLLATGWYFSGTWLVTGERKARGADRPLRPLFHGGAGAIELAGRLEELAFRSLAADGVPSTSPRADLIVGNRDRAVTLGVNWYPVRGLKIQGNLIREAIAQPAMGPLPSQPTFWSRVLRVQLTI